ncbi:hypothetical protein K439DRAFT_1626596 [Ramaria rubella]|nr:hypothetical protein K439DRAFT_1626596 [Ramaria rubella]
MTIHQITLSPAGATPSDGDHQLSNSIENFYDSHCDAIEEKLCKAVAIIHAQRQENIDKKCLQLCWQRLAP